MNQIRLQLGRSPVLPAVGQGTEAAQGTCSSFRPDGARGRFPQPLTLVFGPDTVVQLVSHPRRVVTFTSAYAAGMAVHADPTPSICPGTGVGPLTCAALSSALAPVAWFQCGYTIGSSPRYWLDCSRLNLQPPAGRVKCFCSAPRAAFRRCVAPCHGRYFALLF